MALSETSINYELIAALVAHISRTDKDEGGILVFLPGIAEIKRCVCVCVSVCVCV
jgi:ATP-dependent RNA helicase DHX57